MTTNTITVSDLMASLDAVKEKLTDMEYKTFAEQLSEFHKQKEEKERRPHTYITIYGEEVSRGRETWKEYATYLFQTQKKFATIICKQTEDKLKLMEKINRLNHAYMRLFKLAKKHIDRDDLDIFHTDTELFDISDDDE